MTNCVFIDYFVRHLRRLSQGMYKKVTYTRMRKFMIHKRKKNLLYYNQQCHSLHLRDKQYKQFPKKKNLKREKERGKEKKRECERKGERDGKEKEKVKEKIGGENVKEKEKEKEEEEEHKIEKAILKKILFKYNTLSRGIP